nr:Chain D, H3k27m [Homo sapiens]5HYN_I Chain I, H3k27m [Homo sapiens]5HYN_O Chain O, H3k27m [Homo sapiens]5HYN_T Chain T, H3k27m [Homo sapiens]
ATKAARMSAPATG